MLSVDAAVMWLKDQIKSSGAPNDYVCWNMEHVLVQRPNGKYACVYPYTVINLNWKIIPNEYVLTYMETRNGNFNIFNHFSRGSIVDMSLNEDYPAIKINFSTGESGKLSIQIPSIMMDVENKNCSLQNKYPNYDDYLILVNGKEISFDERLTTEIFRYLEIPYDNDSTEIEIIGSCYT